MLSKLSYINLVISDVLPTAVNNNEVLHCTINTHSQRC